MQFKLPELGEGVHEGELVRWKVKAGDTVKDDQVLCEIMTDKATIEVPAPFHGNVTELMAKEGQVVKVGETLLQYATGAGAVAAALPVPAEKAAGAPRPAALGAAAPNVAPSSPSLGIHAPTGAPVLASPSTRRLARELSVDLARVPASGPAGRVLREDVEKAANGAGATSAGPAKLAGTPTRTEAPPAGSEERIPFRGLRKKIAEKMRLSKDKAAHFTYVEEADATELVKLRDQAKALGATRGVKVTYLPFVMKAMVAALRRFPTLNSSLDESTGELVVKHYYNIGLSIQTDEGLTAPVVKRVETKPVLEIAREIQDLVERARAKKLTLDDFHGGTITLTNAGSIGGLFATPVINYPEVAILGFNKIFRKPVVVREGGKETIAIRDWTYFSISLDHRIVDGAVGAEFMKELIRVIENPALLVLES